MNDSHSHILQRIATNEEKLINLKEDVDNILNNHLPTMEKKIDSLLKWSIGIVVSVIVSFGGTVLFIMMK